MTEGTESEEPKVVSPADPKGPVAPGSSGSKKYLAVIIALIIVIVGLSYLDYNATVYKGSSPTASVSAVSQFGDTGTPINITVDAHSQFSYAQVFFGDNSAVNYSYNGKTTFNVSHTYEHPGEYFVFSTIHYKNSVYSSFNSLVQVSIASKISDQNPDSTYGIFNLISSSSNGTIGNSTLAFKPGTSLQFALGYSTEPSNSSYQVVFQKVTVNSTYKMSDYVSYQFNSTSHQYHIPQSESIVNMSNMSTGFYQVAIQTETANLSATNVSGTMVYTGALNTSAGTYNTTYYEDIVVSPTAALYNAQSTGGTLLNAEVVTGVDNTMDYALQNTVSGQEVVDQVIQYLVAFNGSSDTSFKPELATHLPTITNGGINSNYKNYTVKDSWGTTYQVHIKPYENYTFYISNSSVFTDGQPVTAWDFLYSMARAIVLDGSSHAQGGYLGEFLLPGNPTSSNTFWNITQNITIDNATNSITFHFQTPQPTAVVYQLMATDGSEAEAASWYIQHGAGMAWSPSGFQSYVSYGNSNHYNSYVANHLMSDGPYKLAYMVPDSKIVLVANPSFVSPGPWDPKPSITTVTIEYITNEPSAYLLLKSGAAAAGELPSAYWNQVQLLQQAGKVQVYHYNELSFNFFNFNANINESGLHKFDSSANMPQTFFMNQNVRKAFAYLFNYTEYIDYQVGNSIYNTTFQIPYTGYLPKGAQYYENNSNLEARGSNVPYYDVTMAKQYWNAFINGTGTDSASAMGVTMTTGGVAMYNGKQIQLVIVVPTLRPALLAGATTWAQDLKVLGISVSYTTVPEDQIFALTAGSNYMPISWGGWFSSFAFPNRITSIGLPDNNTFYIGSMDINQWWFSGANGQSPTSNATEVQQMQQMFTDYNNALANGTNATLAKEWYWKTNGLLVNATYVVDVGQGVGSWVLSTSLNPTDITKYELNPFEAGVDRLLYNGLAYTSS